MRYRGQVEYTNAVVARPQKKHRALSAALIAAGVPLLVAALYLFSVKVVIPAIHYNGAVQLMEQPDYLAAAEEFLLLGEFSDAREQAAACYAGLVEDALAGGDLDEAIDYYSAFRSEELAGKEALLPVFYDYAVARMEGSSYRQSLRIFEEITAGYRGSERFAASVNYRIGMERYEQRNYQSAYEIFAGLDASLLPEAIESAGMAQQAQYAEFVAVFEETGTVPEGFFAPMLDGFSDTENYRKYHQLQQSNWSAEDYSENIRLIYELGDFLNTVETGFMTHRIFGRRFVNESGGYLTMGEDGTIASNLPQFRYGGYYGLYSKMEKNIYYIGSDEVLWSRQFRLTFEDNDETLWVYCYSTGSSYRLYREILLPQPQGLL